MTFREKLLTIFVASLVMGHAAAQDRMPRIPNDAMTDAQKKAAAVVLSGPRKWTALQGPFVPMVRSPEFMLRAQAMGEYIRFLTPLDKRINEMGAIMGARLWTQQYEWEAHYRQAIEAGLKPAIANAIAEGRRPTGMAEDEETLYDFLTELFTNKSVSDPTYARAKSKFGEQGVIDILGVVGYYTLLAMIMNVARTPAPEGTKTKLLVPLPH